MPPALTSWTLAESVGLTWPEQVLTHPLDGLRVPDDAPLCVRDDAGGVSAAQRAGDHLFYAAALPAHARRRFDLVLGDSDSLPVHVAAAGDYLELSTPSFGIRIAWTEEPVRYAESRPVIDCPPPVSQIHGSDRTWVGRGGWRGEALCRGFRCETVMKGPLVAAVRQTYDLADGPLTFTYRLDAVSPCVQIDVAANRDDLYAVWHFDDYTPTHAFWRPHSTEDWRGKKSAEDHHRQVYTLGDLRSPDTLFLQPFYSWNRNGAMFWSCWDEPTAASDVLVIGATRPSQTRSTGAFRPHQVRDGQQLHIAVPNGRSSLSMGMQKRAGRSRPRTLEIETLYRQMHGLDLDAYAKMTLHWPAMAETRFPRLFIGPEDLDPIRKTARQWPWFCEAFDSRVRDGLDTSSEPSPVDLPADPGPSGRDPAGAYLVSGDAAYARQAFCQIDEQLTHWVQSLGALGPTVD
ncbi:MAG: hypothetical protein O3B73_04555, partial [bacterium]|nr:hypothetical protein [bacterium]